MKNNYLLNLLATIEEKNIHEFEYLQAVSEFLESLEPLIDLEKKYESNGVLERLLEPERVIIFSTTWADDKNVIHVNRSFRVQHSSAIGPYKGGLRFSPTVNLSIMKFLAFEQTFKNSLTSLPLGGGKGGSDFDPKGKSDSEVMRFCQSFMSELYRHIGADYDIPAGDLGVGAREIGYMYGYYKKLTGKVDCSMTSKPLLLGGALGRKEATGYGLCYFVEEMLKTISNDSFKNKNVIISGSGNVAIYAAEKAQELGARVIAMSDSDGVIFDKEGIDIPLVKKIKEDKKQRISTYVSVNHSATYIQGSKEIWKIAADIVLPCAIQNEIELADAINIVNNKVTLVAEGANMPTSKEATSYLIAHGVLFAPGKASNAGGVAVSGLEMSQNAQHTFFTFAEVDNKLQAIMKNIFHNIYNTTKKYSKNIDLVRGANIASFINLAEAVEKQGII